MAKSFRFKQFSVANERAAMKVGTDGVLLGAWVSLRGDEQHILDVGTGTGVIALMLAQRTDPTRDITRTSAPAILIGIDIDAASAEEATANFKASPWAGRMAAFCGDFRGLGADPSHPLKFLAFPYDLIVSNPPFFVDSLKAPEARRSTARHTDSLAYADLIGGSLGNLAPEGRLALVLPADVADAFTMKAESSGLHLSRRCRVSSVVGRDPVRTLLEFSREPISFFEDSTLAIQNESDFTEEYKSLTRDFYLKF